MPEKQCQRNDDGDGADGFADGDPFARAEFLQPVVSRWRDDNRDTDVVGRTDRPTSSVA